MLTRYACFCFCKGTQKTKVKGASRYAHDIMLLGGLLQKLNLCKPTGTRSYKFFYQKNFLYDVVYITLYHKGNSFTF